MVEVRKRDLSSAYHYFQIAELYTKANKRKSSLRSWGFGPDNSLLALCVNIVEIFLWEKDFDAARRKMTVVLNISG